MESNSKSEEIASYNNITAKKARLQSLLSALLDDPVLSDVPKKPSLADVDTLINLELGSAMKISVVKLDNTSFDVAVPNSATVKDLKLAIRKRTNEIEQAQMGHRHISWRHIWANYCLAHHNEKLIDDNFVLSDHGIRNNSKGEWVKQFLLKRYAPLYENKMQAGQKRALEEVKLISKQQHESVDCGVFLLEYEDCMQKGHPVGEFSQSNMTTLRAKLAMSIMFHDFLKLLTN